MTSANSSTAAAPAASLIPACAYLRVSTQEQAGFKKRKGREETRSLSLDTQAAAIREYCSRVGLALGEHFGITVTGVLMDSGVSAGKLLSRRPAGSDLLALTSGRNPAVRAVVAYSLDRLFRRMSDGLLCLERWSAAGVSVHLVDRGRSYDLALTADWSELAIQLFIAESERRRTVERSRAVAKRERSEGRAVGFAPYGWRAEAVAGQRVLVEDGDEQRAFELMSNMRCEGHSLAAIAGRLNELQVPSKRGGQWHASTVRGILRAAGVE